MSQREDEFALRIAAKASDRAQAAEQKPPAFDERLRQVGYAPRAVAFYQRHGISIERVMTDNGSPYVSAAHAIACRALAVRHLPSRPYRPQTKWSLSDHGEASGHWLGSACVRSEQKATSARRCWIGVSFCERARPARERVGGALRTHDFRAPHWVKPDTVETNEIVDA